MLFVHCWDSSVAKPSRFDSLDRLVCALQEASIAWEKRQAGIRAKRHVAESQARWAKWGAATGVATGHAAKAGREEAGSVPRGSAADTASAAARAARRFTLVAIA